MNHIYTINEMFSDDLITSVTAEDSNEYLEERKRESLDEKDMEVIDEIIGKIKLLGLNVEVKEKFHSKPTSLHMVIPISSKSNMAGETYEGIGCSIVKFVDEYYLCSIYNVYKKSSNKIGSPKPKWEPDDCWEEDEYDGLFYLCDQTIGLELFTPKLIREIKYDIGKSQDLLGRKILKN